MWEVSPVGSALLPAALSEWLVRGRGCVDKCVKSVEFCNVQILKILGYFFLIFIFCIDFNDHFLSALGNTSPLSASNVALSE